METRRIDESELKRLVDGVQSALVVGHIRPDGDAIGSSLALTEALRMQGKKVDVLIPDDFGEKYRFLPLTSEIYRELPDHQYDMIFFVDLSTKERAGAFDWPDVPIVNIDHHVSNPGYTDYLFLRPEAAAVGEMLTKLFLEWNWQITADMANALYMAIATDCGYFKYNNTTEETMMLAGKLISLGADTTLVSNQMEALPRRALTILPKIMKTLRFSADGRLSYMIMDEEAMTVGKDYLDTYLDLIRNVENVELSIQFKYFEPNKTYVSFRSKRVVDVNTLASQFGGGGHIRASGCRVPLSIDETVKLVIPEAEKAIR